MNPLGLTDRYDAVLVHPHWRWHRWLSWLLPGLLDCLLPALLCLLNPSARSGPLLKWERWADNIWS